MSLYAHVHPVSDPRPRAIADAATWREILAHPGLTVLVAEDGAELVSTCTLAVVPNLTRGARPFAVIEAVVTHPDHRRKGHASSLLRHALGVAWGLNCYKVMLVTGKQTEEALRFYDSVGLVRGNATAFVALAPAPSG